MRALARTVPLAALAALLGLAAGAVAQESVRRPPPEKPKEVPEASADADAKAAGESGARDGKVEALPEGQVKVLKAIVISVKGAAQGRGTAEGAAWKALKVNDVLEPGSLIRTGRDAEVALRVGANATVLVERQSRVALPEIAQDGDVLRTRVSLSFGKADVRVDRVGLRNDFEVATPTATLAVRGTTMLIVWNAVQGFRAVGVEGNRLRAIEVQYIDGITALLSEADSTSDLFQLPALDGFFETYFFPLAGAIGPELLDDTIFTELPAVDNPRVVSKLKAAAKQRGDKTGQATGQQSVDER